MIQTDHRFVSITGGGWKAKADLNRDVTMRAVYDRFAETGRIDAFRCDWKEGMPNRPHISGTPTSRNGWRRRPTS